MHKQAERGQNAKMISRFSSSFHDQTNQYQVEYLIKQRRFAGLEAPQNVRNLEVWVHIFFLIYIICQIDALSLPWFKALCHSSKSSIVHRAPKMLVCSVHIHGPT